MQNTNIGEFISDVNNDLENRKRDLPTNPFEKQGQIAKLFPSVAYYSPNSFYFSPMYFPEESRDKTDTQNIPAVIKDFNEVRAQYHAGKTNTSDKVAKAA